MKNKKKFLLILCYLFCSMHQNSIAEQKYVIGQSSNEGLFSCFLTTLNDIVWCEQHNKIPVIFWDKTSRYYVGDGFEMQAVEKEKCRFMSFWSNIGGASYSVEITKYKQVKITYENDELFRLKDKETLDIKSKIF